MNKEIQETDLRKAYKKNKGEEKNGKKSDISGNSKIVSEFMQCFWATICDGEPVLREHEAAKWLRAEELDTVAWLPADLTIIPLIKKKLTAYNA